MSEGKKTDYVVLGFGLGVLVVIVAITCLLKWYVWDNLVGK